MWSNRAPEIDHTPVCAFACTGDTSGKPLSVLQRPHMAKPKRRVTPTAVKCCDWSPAETAGAKDSSCRMQPLPAAATTTWYVSTVVLYCGIALVLRREPEPSWYNGGMQDVPCNLPNRANRHNVFASSHVFCGRDHGPDLEQERNRGKRPFFRFPALRLSASAYFEAPLRAPHTHERKCCIHASCW